MSRKDIKVYLHNMVRDECENEFMYYMADNQVYEHKINQHDQIQAFGASNRPRRDPSKNPLLQPPSMRMKEKKSKTMGGRKPATSKKVMKQAGGTESKEETGETDDLVYTHKERESTEYNNPAKRMGSDHPTRNGIQTYTGDAPRLIKPSKVNYDQYARHFPGVSLEAIKRTFLATTQYGRRGAFPGFHMKHRIKSPNPALSIPRRNEAVATDTVHGPKGVGAIDDGSTAAQFFYGMSSKHRWVVGCGHSDGSFVKTLHECIRKYGAMDALASIRQGQG